MWGLGDSLFDVYVVSLSSCNFNLFNLFNKTDTFANLDSVCNVLIQIINNLQNFSVHVFIYQSRTPNKNSAFIFSESVITSQKKKTKKKKVLFLCKCFYGAFYFLCFLVVKPNDSSRATPDNRFLFVCLFVCVE